MSLLGGLSLIGLLIKNAIVLIDEIDQQIGALHSHPRLHGPPLAPGGTGGSHHHSGFDTPALRCLLRQHVADHHGWPGFRHPADPAFRADALCYPVQNQAVRLNANRIKSGLLHKEALVP
jgi:hypothetical protein